MRTVLLGIALALSMPAVAADVPDSIIGTWEFDPLRTMKEVFDRAAAEREAERQAGSSGPSITLGSVGPSIARGNDSSPGSERPQSPARPSYSMTITEDTITSGSTLETPATVPYKVVGGNAGLFVIESIDANGLHTVSNIRVVEGGIAVDAFDCEQEPDRCKESRGGAPPERALDTSLFPKVLYFTRVAPDNTDSQARRDKRLDAETSNQ